MEDKFDLATIILFAFDLAIVTYPNIYKIGDSCPFMSFEVNA